MSCIEFFTDPARFLREAAGRLADEPVASTVVATTADKAVRHGLGDAPFHWYAVARDGEGDVVGLAMRTAPFAPYPLWVCSMPDSVAVDLVGLLHARGEHPGGVNGALPTARVAAEESARLWGGGVMVAMATCLYELGALTPPAGVPGAPRLATYADLPLCLDWFNAFGPAARAQAGNADAAQGHDVHGSDELRARTDDGLILLWEHGGEVVSLAGCNAPAFGVVRIGPVYTPEPHRGHGYAAAVTAELSRRAVADGHRACLFTDRDNPVSNPLYRRLGYRLVTEMANHTVG